MGSRALSHHGFPILRHGLESEKAELRESIFSGLR